MKELFQIKIGFHNNVYFEGEYESMAECVEAAVKDGISLRGVNLQGANLQNVNLHDVDLRGADLSGANLSSANLHDARLQDANLSYANVYNTNFYNAKLQGADLWSCAGNNCEIRSMFFDSVYCVTYTAEVIQIGCEQHAIADWWEFDDAKILKMESKAALAFWRKNKELIKQVIESNPATKC